MQGGAVMIGVKTCRRGHPQTEENMRPRVYSGEATRRCRACHREVRQKVESIECECGNTKDGLADACARCQFLDGKSTAPARSLIIATLRTTPDLSIVEINKAIFDGKPTQTRSVLRALNEMVRDGRVQRFWQEGDAYDRPTKLPGTERFIAAGANQGRYIYRLTAPARGEIGRAA